MKTYFETLSDIAEYGMEVEQTIRLIQAQKEWLDNIKQVEYVYERKMAILNRAERIVKGHLKRYKEEITNKIL